MPPVNLILPTSPAEDPMMGEALDHLVRIGWLRAWGTAQIAENQYEYLLDWTPHGRERAGWIRQIIREVDALHDFKPDIARIARTEEAVGKWIWAICQMGVD